MPKKINRALIQGILSKGEGVKSVSSEAVDWVIAVTEHTARQLAASGRRTPSGRLMAPKMDPGLQSRHLTQTMDYRETELRVLGAESVKIAEGPTENPTVTDAKWSEYHDWQLAVRSGATKLKFEEWKEQGKNGTTD